VKNGLSFLRHRGIRKYQTIRELTPRKTPLLNGKKTGRDSLIKQGKTGLPAKSGTLIKQIKNS
jgi:hypothetical protein